MAFLTHVTLGYNDVPKAKEFYNYVLEPLGYKMIMDMDHMAMFGDDSQDSPRFGVLSPRNGEPANAANGFTLGFVAPSRASVNEFYKRAIEKGATDEGAPGPRDFAPTAYAAYFRDIGGHKVCAYCMAPE